MRRIFLLRVSRVVWWRSERGNMHTTIVPNRDVRRPRLPSTIHRRPPTNSWWVVSLVHQTSQFLLAGVQNAVHDDICIQQMSSGGFTSSTCHVRTIRGIVDSCYFLFSVNFVIFTNNGTTRLVLKGKQAYAVRVHTGRVAHFSVAGVAVINSPHMSTCICWPR